MSLLVISAVVYCSSLVAKSVISTIHFKNFERYVFLPGADPAPELTDAYIRPRICRGVRGYPPPGNFET
jgi:hypothetical protein